MLEKLQKNLDQLKGKNIGIVQGGFLQSKYDIQNTQYFEENEILNIIDGENGNYLKINLNQAYKIDSDQDKTKIYLDNDLIITINRKEIDQ